jgi:predicted amidohydrolase
MSRSARIALLQLPAFAVGESEASLAHTMRRIDEVVASEQPDLIALPEVTYPAYFLGTTDLGGTAVLSPDEVASRFAAKARAHGILIAAGLALDAPQPGEARYTNGALLFGRNGSVVGRYDKSFLWHFDNRWFAPGRTYPVFETDIGRVGILVCADGRLPEIARCLTLSGAQIILDLTAWVSGGRQPSELSTTQFEYLMRVRAAENGVWVACADKCGTEAECVVYAGRSCFIHPRGDVVAALGSDEEGPLVFDVPIADAQPPVRHRPELYETLTQPTDTLPVLQTLAEALVPSEQGRRIAVVQMTMPPDGERFVAAARRHAERQVLMDASIIVFPATPSRYRHTYDAATVDEEMLSLARDTGICVAYVVWEPDGDGHRAIRLTGPDGILASHRQTHKPPGERFATMPLGDVICPVVETPAGRLGLMLAAEAAVPEAARSLMLRGAEILLWASDDPRLPMIPFARARAEENRVFVACAGAPTANGAAAVVDPDGRVLAVALEGAELAVGADVNRGLAHIKERAPGTHVVLGRQPETYTALTHADASKVPSKA